MAGGPLAGLLKDLEADCFANSEQRVLAAFVVGGRSGSVEGGPVHAWKSCVIQSHAAVLALTIHARMCCTWSCLARAAGDEM